VPEEWWGHAYWVEGQDMSRQLVKALYEKNYGKGFHGHFQQVVDSYNEQHTDHDQRVGGMNRHVGERFQGLSYCGATLLKDKACILEFLETRQDNEWLRKLTAWFKSERCTVFLSICAILHTTFGKRSFEVTKQNMSVVTYKTYVDTMIYDLDKYTEDPRLTLESEGRGMCLVRALPDTTKVWLFLKLKPLMLRMATMFKEYTKAFNEGELDHTTYLPGHAMLDALRIAPATSCFEESGFAVLKRVLELGGVTLSPWKATGTTLYKINKGKLGKMTLAHVHKTRALAKKNPYRNNAVFRMDQRQRIAAWKAVTSRREAEQNVAKAAAKDKKAEEKAAKDAAKEAEKLRKAEEKKAQPPKPSQKRKAPDTPVETGPMRSARQGKEKQAAEQEAEQAAKQAAEQADKQAAQQAAAKYVADMTAAGVAWWLPVQLHFAAQELLAGNTCMHAES
jgi:outer membrane biosynthesis protein TonB